MHVFNPRAASTGSSTATTTTTTPDKQQPNVVHTESTATGGLVVPPARRDIDIDIDITPILQLLRSTTVVVNGETLPPFGQALPGAPNHIQNHEQTMAPKLPLVMPKPGKFAPATTDASVSPTLPAAISPLSSYASSAPTPLLTDPVGLSSVVASVSPVISAMPGTSSMSGKITIDVATLVPITGNITTLSPTVTATTTATATHIHSAASEVGVNGMMWVALLAIATLMCGV